MVSNPTKTVPKILGSAVFFRKEEESSPETVKSPVKYEITCKTETLNSPVRDQVFFILLFLE